MTMYNTLLLDRDTWDLVIDNAGNIAMAEPPYALAQDVASALKLFMGELWYDTTKGIPYFEEVFAKLPPAPKFIAMLEKAAMSVPGVVSVQVLIDSNTVLRERKVIGQVRFIDESGRENAVVF